MDVLKILTESAEDLYLEDLDFFETELATGGPYTASYRTKCQEKINEIRNWFMQNNEENNRDTDPGFIDINKLAPRKKFSDEASLTTKERIFNDIRFLRESGSYKTQFKEYVEKKTEIDTAFVDMNYSFFQPWELNAIISVKQMDEEFLEKYFGALDHDKIARYQQFSEAFYMKHFSELDANVVLEQGPNKWKKKERRSKQLDIFLRLKGVNI